MGIFDIKNKKRKNCKKVLTNQKGFDIITESQGNSDELNMREWRNWQTRTFEGRVVHTVRVQVPSLAPTQKTIQSDGVLCWYGIENGT